MYFLFLSQIPWNIRLVQFACACATLLKTRWRQHHRRDLKISCSCIKQKIYQQIVVLDIAAHPIMFSVNRRMLKITISSNINTNTTCWNWTTFPTFSNN